MGSLQQYSKRTNHGSTRNLHDEKLPLLTETMRHVRKTGSQLASVPQGFTSKFTALSAITFSPAAGVCATMMLVGDAEGGGLGTAPRGGVAGPAWSPAWVETLTVPSRNPASGRARATLPSDGPTKFGITNACGAAAVVTSRLIFGAETPLALAGGLCEIT